LHPPKADSTPCTDTDGNTCTTAGCEVGLCVQPHITTCNEVCRTPGFWGTHGDADPEKQCSQNITQAVIDDCGGTLSVCGQSITNTGTGNANSALEAICVRVRGEKRLQLARQMTSAALNCCVSGGPADCSEASIAALFSDCNLACQGLAATRTVSDCIGAIDCFNNGGTYNEATGVCEPGGPGNCHEQALPLADLPLPNNDPSTGRCYGQQGPAGSPDECNEARGNSCSVFDCGP
jgi:hypothetical protein